MANLLSTSAQKHVFVETLNSVAVALCILGAIPTIVGIAALVPAYVTWQEETRTREYELASLEGVQGYDYVELAETVSSTNKRLKILNVLSSGESVANAIRTAGRALPAEGSITKLEYHKSVGAEKEGHLQVVADVGTEDNKDTFVAGLRASELFSSVDVPITSLVGQGSDSFIVELSGLF